MDQESQLTPFGAFVYFCLYMLVLLGSMFWLFTHVVVFLQQRGLL